MNVFKVSKLKKRLPVVLFICLITQLNACAVDRTSNSHAPLPASTDSVTTSATAADSITMSAVNADPATMFSIKTGSSIELTSGTLGFSNGNISLYEGRDFNCNDNWIFLSSGAGDLIKLKKDGSESEVIYHPKGGDGYISDINLMEDWVFFSLKINESATKSTQKSAYNYYICKVKTDGTCFQKLTHKAISQLYVTENTIYYSLYPWSGGAEIHSMDFNGENDKLLFDEKNIWFKVFNDKICAIQYPRDTWRETCDLYLLNLDGSALEKVFTLNEQAHSPNIFGNTLYFKNQYGKLSKITLNGQEKILLASDVSEYCIDGDWIYFVTVGMGDIDKVSKIKTDGSSLTLLNRDAFEGMHGISFRGIFQGRLYFTGAAGTWEEEDEDYYQAQIITLKKDGSGLTRINMPEIVLLIA